MFQTIWGILKASKERTNRHILSWEVIKFGGNRSMILIPPFPTKRNRKILAFKEK